MSGVVAQHLPLEDVPQQHTLKPPHTDFANNCSLPKVFREITASKASNMTFWATHSEDSMSCSAWHLTLPEPEWPRDTLLEPRPATSSASPLAPFRFGQMMANKQHGRSLMISYQLFCHRIQVCLLPSVLQGYGLNCNAEHNFPYWACGRSFTTEALVCNLEQLSCDTTNLQVFSNVWRCPRFHVRSCIINLFLQPVASTGWVSGTCSLTTPRWGCLRIKIVSWNRRELQVAGIPAAWLQSSFEFLLPAWLGRMRNR